MANGIICKEMMSCLYEVSIPSTYGNKNILPLTFLSKYDLKGGQDTSVGKKLESAIYGLRV